MEKNSIKADKPFIIAYPSPFEFESRILREMDVLQSTGFQGQIYVFATRKAGLPKREKRSGHVNINRLGPSLSASSGRLKRLLTLFIWQFLVLFHALRLKPACINPHSLSSLPVSVLVKVLTQCKLLYSPHELESRRAGASELRNRTSQAVEGICLRFADHVVVVGEAIANWYEKTFKLPPVDYVRNFPARLPALGEKEDYRKKLRTAMGLVESDLLFIYIGLLGNGRGLDGILEAFQKKLPGKYLLIVGFGPLQPQIEQLARTSENIHFLPAVEQNDIPLVAGAADVSLVLIENVGLSYFLCSPNKLFESLNAGTPVLGSDFPEIRSIVGENELGWLIEPTQKKIKKIIKIITKKETRNFSINAEKWSQYHNWENEKEKLFTIYNIILGINSDKAA